MMSMSMTTTPSMRQAYLLKDRETHFAFERNRDAQVSNNHLRIALLYKANKDSFVRYPGELYNDEHIRQIHKAIQMETENSANWIIRIDLLANFDKFYQEVKVLTIVKFPERFVKSLLNYVAEPKISIRGSYKLIWHDCTAHEDPWMILDDHAHEFSVPGQGLDKTCTNLYLLLAAISLKENQPVIKTTNFNGAEKITQFYITELLSDVRMKYSVILEWKDFSVNAEAVRLDVLDKLYSDKRKAPFSMPCSQADYGNPTQTELSWEM
ncbi:hypothetical protein Ocin01_19320 [Orchesella cincta]|uniref:Uncharacterized protein n=1 Tax=Orchesella cincta TaxID=48709 RepID=A0A1D2M345_ORCCI|nr:hypothetical protein Ocin01_19320 [Orchesella cincta]